MTSAKLNQLADAGLDAFDLDERGWRKLARNIEEAEAADPRDEEEDAERWDGQG